MSVTTFRSATREDVSLILRFIRILAEYEKLAHEVTATEDGLAESLFGPRATAEVLFAERAGQAVGFALFFPNYSTFLGKAGMYVEDVCVLPECRGQGVGRAFFAELTRIAAARGYGRMEWSVLDWNRPAIDFYESLGAKPNEGWTLYRLTEEQIQAL